MTFFHMSSKTIPRIKDLFADITLEICIKLSMELMLVLHAAVHIPERLVTLVTSKSCKQVVHCVIVHDRLIILLEFSVTQEAIVNCLDGSPWHQNGSP